MATLEELEARLAALETQVSKIKSCTCDPSNYASAEDMRQAQRKIDGLETALGNVSNKIGTLPDGKTVVSYIDEQTANAGGGGVSTEEFNGLATRVDGLDDFLARVGTIPEGKTLVEYINEKAASGGLTEKEVAAMLTPLEYAINNLKNTPTYKLLWTASELQAVLGGILSSADTTNFTLADGLTLVTSDGNTFNAKEI